MAGRNVDNVASRGETGRAENEPGKVRWGGPEGAGHFMHASQEAGTVR